MRQINPVYKDYWRSGARYLCLYGGAGSSKSVTAAQKMISLAASSEKVRVLVLRKTARTCRHSTFALLKDVLSGMGRLSRWRVNKQDMTMQAPSGGDILHAGLDDVQKLKSISGVTHIWIEEATELDFPEGQQEEDLAQVDLRLRGVDAELNPSITLTFNPTHQARRIFDYLDVAESSLPERDAVEQGDVFIQHTTHEDNPFVGEEYTEVFRRLGGHMQTIYEGGKLARADDPQQVVPYHFVKKACDLAEPEGGAGFMGVDVARYGGDATAIAHKEGGAIGEVERYEGKSTTEVADIVAQRMAERDLPASQVGIDAVGIGAGVVDSLKNRGFEVVPIVSGESPRDDGPSSSVRFRNLRSQMWWVLRKALSDGRVALPDCSKRLEEDLCAPRYKIAAGRTVKVEPKEKTKSRLGRSPDDGDAVVYACALAELELGQSEDWTDIQAVWQ